MVVNSTSSQSILLSISVASASMSGAAAAERPKDQPSVDKGEHRRRHGHDEFRPTSQLKKLFSMLDTNKDGGIDAEELTSVIDRLGKQDPSAALPSAQEVLEKLDTNGDGSIGRRELRRAMQARWRERVQEFAPGTTPGAPQPAAGAGTPSQPPTPVTPPSAPTDGVPQAPESAGTAPAGQSLFISATVVTIAIRTYANMSQAPGSQTTAEPNAVR